MYLLDSFSDTSVFPFMLVDKQLHPSYEFLINFLIGISEGNDHYGSNFVSAA